MSKKHHHSSSYGSSKQNKIARRIVGFFLFASIFTLSVAVCTKAVILNPNEIASTLTNQDYSNAMYLDAQQYAYDLCDECGIPRECVDEDITYTAISEINNAYIYGNLTDDERYSESTYKDKIDELEKDIRKTTSKQIKEQKIEVNSMQAEKGIETFSQKISNYVTKIVEIEYLSKIQTLTNVSRVGLIALMVVSIVSALLLLLGEISIGKTKYRNVRMISFSFIAAGMLDFILAIGVEIVEKTKSLYIFPTYLCDAAMVYVENSQGVFVGAGLAATIVAIILSTVVWRLKRDDK